MLTLSGEQHVDLQGVVFEEVTAHQLVLDGCAGFVIGATFANGDTSRHAVEPAEVSRRSIFAQIDGAGVLVTGQSDLTFEDCVFQDNVAMMCGGGVSLQALPKSTITFRSCRFLDNVAADTGSALDVLTPGMNVVLENCVFDGNSTNRWTDIPRGHVSVFPQNRLKLVNCTFRGGSLDVDYHGKVELDVTGDYRIHDVSGKRNPKIASKVLTIAKAWTQHPTSSPRV